MLRSRSRAIFVVLRRTLNTASRWLTSDATSLVLPTHVLRLSVGVNPGNPHSYVVSAALTSEWKKQASSFDPRLVPNSLVLDEWTIDFGDGNPSTCPVSDRIPETVSLTHTYEPGFYVVTVTAKGSGQAPVIVNIPQVGLLGEGSESIVFSCRAIATVLVQE